MNIETLNAYNEAERLLAVAAANTMSEEDVAEAKRLWAEQPENCEAGMRDDGFEGEATEATWLAYCQWCAFEYGASIWD